MPYKVIIIVLIMNLSNVAIADCFFVRLNGYQQSARYDFLYWGEFSPLIALEAGHFYNLSPKGMTTTGRPGGKVKNLSGELYYIPQHLINKDKQFSLRMMVLDRDEDSRDDIVLPLSERTISLESTLFINDLYETSISIRRSSTIATRNNDQVYEFQILKNSKNCRTDTAEGRMNDDRYRSENNLKRLHLHIRFYEQPFLNGGYEYLSYKSPKIQHKSYSAALSAATNVASINSNELIALGTKLKKLNNTEGFSVVWNEYKQLIKRLYKQRLTVKYREEKILKKIKVPTLSFHPKWKELSGRSDFRLPKEWFIDLTEHY